MTDLAQQVKDARKELRELRAKMKAEGIRKISPFNGGLDILTMRYNEQRFALETRLDSLKSKQLEASVRAEVKGESYGY